MQRMLFALGAMFFHLQFFFEYFFIASGVIIYLLTNFASHFGDIFPGH